MPAVPQLLTIGSFLLGSYTTFHGHRLHQDCWLCNYRGLGWIMAVGIIITADYLKETQKENSEEEHWETSSTDSDDSNETVKPN